MVMWIAFYASLLSLLYLLVVTFRTWLDREGSLGRFLNPNSYGVYIIHMAVLGVIALLLLDTGIPSLGKYAILTLSTYAVCNVLVFGYRRFLKPGLTTWMAPFALARPATGHPTQPGAVS